MLADLVRAWWEEQIEARHLHTPNAMPPPAPLRFRPRQWQFFGFALGMFVAALIAPNSGWILRQQARLCASGESMAIVADTLTREAGMPVKYPVGRSGKSEQIDAVKQYLETNNIGDKDVETAVARALFSHRKGAANAYNAYWAFWTDNNPEEANKVRERMSALMQRFPDSPLPCFVYLVSLNPTGRRYDQKLHARYLDVTRCGERLDPENAVFPYLRVLADYEAHDENAALQDLAMAVQKPRWNEYSIPLMRGVWRLQEQETGMQNTLLRAAALTSIGFWEFYSPPMLVSYLLSDAARREQAGDVAGGVAIRGRLLRIAVKMHNQASARMRVGSGQSLFMAACKLHNNLRHVRRTSNPTDDVRDYQNYLCQHGYQAEAQWIQRVSGATPTFPLVPWPATDFQAQTAYPLQTVAEAQYYWTVGLCLLVETILILLLGAAVAGLNWRRRFSAQRPRALSGPAIRGAGMGLLFAGSVIYVLRTCGAEGITKAIDVLPYTGLVCAAASVLGLMRDIRAALTSALLAFVVVCGVTACCFAPLCSALLTNHRLVQNSLQFPASYDLTLHGIVGTAFALTFRLLTLTAVSALVCAGFHFWRVRRMPLGAAMWRGASAGLLPFIGLLLLVCAGWSLVTARAEAGANTILLHLLDSEKQARVEALEAARQNAGQNKGVRASRVLTGDIQAFTNYYSYRSGEPR